MVVGMDNVAAEWQRTQLFGTSLIYDEINEPCKDSDSNLTDWTLLHYQVIFTLTKFC